MSLTTTPRRTKRGRRNAPTPLDMSLLAVPGVSNPRRRSGPRPSIKESVAALGLGYSLSSSGLPGLSGVPGNTPLRRPLPRIPGSPFPRSSPKLALTISPATSSEYTTTDSSASSLAAPPLTTPPHLTRLYTLSLPPSPVRQESADATIRPPPSHSPPEPKSPVTPALLSPAPLRPARRWGMTIFPQTETIRRVSSAPPSPLVFNNSPISPTSIIGIKSPVERRDSRRISDPLTLMTPFAVAFPEESDAPLVPPIPVWVLPPPSITLRIPPVPVSLPPAPKLRIIDISAKMPRSTLALSETTLGRGSGAVTIEGSDAPVKSGGKQRRSSQVKPNPSISFRRTNSNHKRVAPTRRRESSTGRPYRRLMMKRDSGMPFANHVAAAAAPIKSLLFAPSQPEGLETREIRRSTKRWSTSGRFLRMSNRRSKATVVTTRNGKEEVEEKDIVAVIPQLRELKAPKRSRW